MGNHGFLPSPRMTQSALDSRMEFSNSVHPELISPEVLLCTFVLKLQYSLGVLCLLQQVDVIAFVIIVLYIYVLE